MLELGMSFSMEQLVIDNEIIGMCRYFKKGVAVNDETLALDAIKEVGAGGDFLGHPSTLANVDLPSNAKILDRNMYGGWAAGGKKDAVDVAHEIVVKALANPPTDPVTPEVDAAMEAVIEKKLKQLTEEVY